MSIENERQELNTEQKMLQEYEESSEEDYVVG